MKQMKLALYSLLTTATLLALTTNANAQAYDDAIWRFGIFGGMNFNIVGVGAQDLQYVGTDIKPVNGNKDIIDGTGLGFYTGLMTEYAPGGLFGGQLRVGLDDRRVGFNDWDVNGTQRTRFSARMTYVSVEPLLRVNLVQPNFHLTVGPLLSFKVAGKYDYIPGRDETSAEIKDQEIPNLNGFTYGVSGGLGYDILMNSKSSGNTRWYLTPFIEASYMMDQRTNQLAAEQKDRNDTWVTTSLRGGFQLKFGAGPAAPIAETVVVDESLPSMDVSLRAPSNITEERKLIEFFPLRNYLFFEDGSTTLPSKYVKLNTSQASSFDEKSLLEPAVTGTSGATTRSQRQMGVYYNGLNVYGERLRNNSTATITLVGSAPAEADGKAMAEDVKSYLVSAFGIDASRITTKGQRRPPHESGTRATPKEDLGLVAEENRRVEVLSSDNSIMMPVEIHSTQAEPIDNDLVLGVTTMGPIESWTVNVNGNGYNQTYGPYRGSSQRIDAKPILGTSQSGTYTATVTATTASGKTVTKTQNFQLVKTELPPVTGQRFSILFEFDESKTVKTYEQFLRQEVAPKIPSGSSVVIHGHTDKVGEEDYNIDLSNRRSTETQRVLQDELTKLGRTVTFDAYGFGETEMRAPFENTTPEGRYYNRTVLIEVIPTAGQ